MKKDKISIGEIALTLIMFGWIVTALLGGMHLIGIAKVPEAALSYIGAALVAYVVVGFVAITLLSVKFILKKG